MPGPRLELTSLVTQVARGVRTALDQRFAELGLTSQQAGVLLHVSGGTTSPRKLADLLGTDTAGMTRLVDRLVEKDYLDRQPGSADRRAITVALTPAGRKILPAIKPIFDDVADTVTAGIPAAALADVLKALEAMRAAVS
ncbi:MarR family winged helix-turn-helix transcriptional regulator [Kribbella sp. NPDC058693]|uniref:MarR family winged helix-turn-helix transcriptional regulator n=1 Tax=Kribbella sp. NPDC058693 TaxID=3346602 RepID=UPI003653869F